MKAVMIMALSLVLVLVAGFGITMMQMVDQIDNTGDAEDWLTSLGYAWAAPGQLFEGPTGRSSTLVVAASDASAASIAQADYVCDGVADNVQLLAAHDALPAEGGLIRLVGNDFTASDEVEFTKLVTLEGDGQYVTVWNMGVGITTSAFVFNLSSANYPFPTIKNMSIFGSGAATANPLIHWEANCQDGKLDHVYISNHEGNVVQYDSGAGWDFYIESTVIESNGGTAVYIDDSSVHILDSHMVNNYINLDITESSVDVQGGKIAKSENHNILLTSPERFSINGTRIEDAGGRTGAVTNNTYDDIHITTDGATQIGRVQISDLPYLGIYDVANSTRYGVYIDRNGLTLTGDWININNVEAASFGTAPIGFADAGSWTKRFKVSDFYNTAWQVYDSSINYIQEIDWGDTATAVAGTGVANLRDNFLQSYTGANAASSARATSDTLYGFVTAAGLNQNTSYWYFNRPIIVDCVLDRTLAGDTPTAYLQLNQTAGLGDLTARGFGLQAHSYDLYAEAYGNGVHTEVDTGYNFSSGVPIAIQIVFMPGEFIAWRVDGTCVYLLTANLPSGQSTTIPRLNAGIETTNAGNAQWNVSNVILRYLGEY